MATLSFGIPVKRSEQSIIFAGAVRPPREVDGILIVQVGNLFVLGDYQTLTSKDATSGDTVQQLKGGSVVVKTGYDGQRREVIFRSSAKKLPGKIIETWLDAVRKLTS